ncbi:DUF2140 family protein [Macrococcoides caseolyticum]|uniref:DUF2140 family protein n=1 Tax=Macrococcoides caseolyticum TaxID=69966 RepID=UPI001F15E27E|nr:DUF2140 family protein [Macrococcus caseolyticus]MCE4957021.1 DUF2140 family protein [Macrococcus caseolyticus]
MIKLIKNPIWFVLFIILLIVNIGAFIKGYQILSLQPDDETIKINQYHIETSDQLILSEQTIEKMFDLNEDAIQIDMKQHAIYITSKSKFMKLDVITKIKTTPEVIAPGVIALNIKAIDIGKLPISDQHALEIIQKFGQLPDSIELQIKRNRFIYDLGVQKSGGNTLLLQSIDKAYRWHFKIKLKE